MIITNPKNQHELVLYTLIYPPIILTISYWMEKYKTYKFSTRLGELEKELNIKLCNRKDEKFVNVFGHHSSYKIYTPCLDKQKYIDIYNIYIKK